MDDLKTDEDFIDVMCDYTEHDSNRELARRLDALGWALFFIMIGGLWMVPPGTAPEGTWLTGAGIIILGVSGFRLLFGLRAIRLNLLMGILALAIGLSDMYALKLPIFSIILVIVGISIIIGLFKHK